MLPAPEMLATQVGELLLLQRKLLVTAESCTGGWIAKLITDVPGSSAWFDRGFVTYSNAAKQEMLGVQGSTLGTHGAVSAETVQEMACGALANSQAHIAVAVSGIAGPEGGTPDKPVGLVWLSWASKEGTPLNRQQVFPGDREAVRWQTAVAALRGLSEILSG